MFILVLLDGILVAFFAIPILYSRNCISVRLFKVLFENFTMRWLGKRKIGFSAYAQPTIKFRQFLRVNDEMILSLIELTEHFLKN
jgi:hypothetical protein